MTCSANPASIHDWAKWAAQPIDQRMPTEVLEIFEPVKNIMHKKGLPENM